MQSAGGDSHTYSQTKIPLHIENMFGRSLPLSQTTYIYGKLFHHQTATHPHTSLQSKAAQSRHRFTTSVRIHLFSTLSHKGQRLELMQCSLRDPYSEGQVGLGEFM